MRYTVLDATQIRVNHKKLRKLSERKIKRYLRDYEQGCDFPPITVDDCGGFYISAMVDTAFRRSSVRAT